MSLYGKCSSYGEFRSHFILLHSVICGLLLLLLQSRDEANAFCRNFSYFGRPSMSLVSFPTENDLEWIALTFSIICPKCRMWTAGTCDRQLIPSDANNPNLFSVSSSNYLWNGPWGQPVARSMYCNDQIRPDNCGSGNSLILSTERRYCLEEVNETNQTEAYALCL